MLLPSLGTTATLWDGVVARMARLAPAVRILRIDLPGHGASPAATEAFSVADLAAAALHLVDEVGGGRFHVAGVSLGGAIALELAATSDRVTDLALVCSGARIGEAAAWAERAAQVRASGTASLVSGSAGRWFAPGYLDANPAGPGATLLQELVDVDDESYSLCCEALAAFDRTASVAEIVAPTLLLSGEFDAVTTPAAMRELAVEFPVGHFVELAGASHLAVAEDPTEAALALAAHMSLATSWARGMRPRRAVLGDDHVDRAIAGDDRRDRRLPGLHHPLRLGRDLGTPASSRAATAVSRRSRAS